MATAYMEIVSVDMATAYMTIVSVRYGYGIYGDR